MQMATMICFRLGEGGVVVLSSFFAWLWGVRCFPQAPQKVLEGDCSLPQCGHFIESPFFKIKLYRYLRE